MRRLTGLVALLPVLIGSMLAGCASERSGAPAAPIERRMPRASLEGLGPGGKEIDALERGDRAARVRVEAYYPLNRRHKPVVDLLLGLADHYPGEVYVRVVDFRTERGKKLWYASGLTCGGLQINGKSEILLKGRRAPTSFLQAIDVFWTRKDLEAAVNEAVQAAR